MSKYDTIILGSSPNALTAASYLARQGNKVLVLEPTENIGGAHAATEFADGFKADIGFTCGRVDQSIAADLKLGDHGLDVIERKSITALLPKGKSFTLTSSAEGAAKAIAKFSQKDAQQYTAFMQLLDKAADCLKLAYSQTPPNEHPPTPADAKQLGGLTDHLRSLGRRDMTEVMRLSLMSIRDMLDERFENPELKGLLASAGIRGISQGPFAAATSFNLLHHHAIGDSYARATAKGGTGAIASALAAAAKALGAELRTNCGALSIDVLDGVAVAVRAAGETFAADAIVSDFDARHTFTKLIAPPELEPEFNRAVKNVRYKGSVARINFALNSLPTFEGLSEEALAGTLIVAPSLQYLERAFDVAKRGGISSEPFMEVTIPSLLDSSLAPEGKHVMSVWLQYVPANCNSHREVQEIAVKALEALAPGLKSQILHARVLLPVDFETNFALTEGQLYGGEMNLAQAYMLRPIPGYSNYEGPLTNLYMCGSAVHPGGGMHGLCGRNVAHRIKTRVVAVV